MPKAGGDDPGRAYRRFATCIAARTSDVDVGPLSVVEDIFRKATYRAAPAIRL